MPTTEQVVSGSVEAAEQLSQARAAERNTNDLRQKQMPTYMFQDGNGSNVANFRRLW